MDKFGPRTSAEKGKRISEMLDECGPLLHTDSRESLEEIVGFIPERHWNAVDAILNSYDSEVLGMAPGDIPQGVEGLPEVKDGAKETAAIVETGGSAPVTPNDQKD